jgi:PBS lyase HEAT-like repeat
MYDFCRLLRITGAVLLMLFCLVIGAESGESAVSDEGGLSDREMAALSQAFDLLGITESDLNFSKRPVFNERTILDYGRRLPLVDRAMDRPIELPAICRREGVGWGGVKQLSDAVELLYRLRAEDPSRFNEQIGDDTTSGSRFELSALVDVVTGMSESLSGLYTQSDACSLYGRTDVAELDGSVIVRAFDEGCERLCPVACLPLLRIIETLLEVDAEGDFGEFAGKAPIEAHPNVQGSVMQVVETAYGELIVGGPGDNVYESDLSAPFIIDLGGNDTYRCPVAAAAPETPVSICVDISGDDHYCDPGEPTQGAATGGIAILVDKSGNDIYQCHRLGQAGALLGIAILADFDGDDVYLGGEQVQGYATGGDALLLDFKGNDTYRADRFAQASSEVLGVAALADQQGNDLYYTGGVFPHAPLMPENYQCFSQGFSIGQRYGHGGGVSLLADQAGNDVYQADVFAIATAYWLSLGMLYDGGGHDTYKAHIYTMGSGIHLAAGILMDQAGNDTYTTGTGVAQGCGHDFAVGMLIDRSGDDRYMAGTGTSQGAADENSVALLLDSAGRDSYACEDAHAQGSGKARYGAPSVALCLDLEDENADTETTGPLVRRTGAYGLYLGYPPEPLLESGSAQLTSNIDRLEITDNSLEGLWGYASLWQVGRNEWAVHESRRRLIERAEASIDFIITEKMTETNIYAIRAMHTVFGGLQSLSITPLISVLSRDDVQARRNAMEVLSRFSDPAVAEQVAPYLSDTDPAVLQHGIAIQKRHRNGAASNGLCRILDDPARDLYLRVAAVSALGAIGDPVGVERLRHHALSCGSLPLRHAAYTALGDSEAGLAVLGDLIVAEDKTIRLWAVRGLGASSIPLAEVMLRDALERETDERLKPVYLQMLNQ